MLARTQQLPDGALRIDENAIKKFRTRFEPLQPDESHRLIITD